jgi:hypothetical protein
VERGCYGCPADGQAYITKSSWLITCTPSAASLVQIIDANHGEEQVSLSGRHRCRAGG